MSVLASIKTSKAVKKININPVERRRAKLVEKLQEQFKGAEALLENKPFSPTKTVPRENEDGIKIKVEVPKRFKPWYWHDLDGVWHLEVKYGNKLLKLNKAGNTAVLVGEKSALPSTIQLVIDAVQAGELDAAIEECSVKRKM